MNIKTPLLFISALSLSGAYAIEGVESVLEGLSQVAGQGAIVPEMDPFAPKTHQAVDAGGAYGGEALDISQKRAISRLTPAEAQEFFGANIPEGILVKNVYHQGIFYVAVIPKQGPRHVMIQLEHFPPEAVAGHTQFRFRFEKPVLLFKSASMQNASHANADAKVDDLLFSAEYHAPKGVDYGLVEGAEEKYFNLIHRLVSLDTKVDSMIREQGHTVDQFRLDLYPDQIRSIFETALARAEKAGYTESYHTILKSCTTELWDVLVDALKIERILPATVSRVPVTVEMVLKYLEIRMRLVGEDFAYEKIATLNAETGAVKSKKNSGASCRALFR